MLIRETLRRRRESPDSSVSERIEAKSTLVEVGEEEEAEEEVKEGEEEETGREICFKERFGGEGRRDDRITLGFVERICPEEENSVYER